MLFLPTMRDQRGALQLLLIVIILIGIAIGLFLVLKGDAIFKSKASNPNPIYATILNVNVQNGNFIGLGQSRAIPQGLLNKELFAPGIFFNVSGYNTRLFLINPNSSVANVTVTVKKAAVSLTAADPTEYSATLNIDPMGMIIVQQSNLSAPNGYYSGNVHSSVPILGHADYARNALGSFTDTKDIFLNHLIPASLAGNKIGNLKVYDKSFGPWDSGHAIMNTLDQDVTVNIKIYDEHKNTLAASKEGVVIPKKSALSIFAPSFVSNFAANGALSPDGSAGFNGSLLAEVTNPPGAKALVSYYQIVKSGTDNDTISYVGMSDAEASTCNYIFPMYLDYTDSHFISGFTIQSLNTDIPGANYEWITPGKTVDITPIFNIYEGVPLGVNKQNSFYKFSQYKKPNREPQSYDRTIEQFQGKVLVNKVCGKNQTPIISLSNGTNEAASVFFGDAGLSEAWADTTLYAPIIKYPGAATRLNTLKIYSPANSSTLIKLSIFKSNGQLVSESPIILSSGEIKDWLDSQSGQTLDNDFQGFVKIEVVNPTTGGKPTTDAKTTPDVLTPTSGGDSSSCPLPRAPVGLSESANDSQTFLNWETVPGTQYYKVQVSDLSGNVVINDPHYESNPPYPANLNNGDWRWTVQTVNGCGEGGTATKTFTKTCPLPPAPTNIQVSDSFNQVTINWDPAPGASYSKIKIQDSVTTVFNDSHFESSPPYPPITLNNGDWRVTVQSVNSCGDGGASSKTFTHICTPLRAPVGLSESFKGNQTFLNWETVPGTQYYKVQVSDLSGNVVINDPHYESNPPYPANLDNGDWRWTVQTVNVCGEGGLAVKTFTRNR